MPRKRLQYHEVLRVVSRDGDFSRAPVNTEMRPLPLSAIAGECPPGHYALYSQGIVLPKRKRGEKFIVQYTTIHQTTF